MKDALRIAFVMLLILLANYITGAEVGRIAFALGKPTASTMRDLTISVPFTKVDGRSQVGCTVYVIGNDGKVITQTDVTDILEHDGTVRKTIQVSRADASNIVSVTVNR